MKTSKQITFLVSLSKVTAKEDLLLPLLLLTIRRTLPICSLFFNKDKSP